MSLRLYKPAIRAGFLLPKNNLSPLSVMQQALSRLIEIDALLTRQLQEIGESESIAEWFFHLPWPAWLKSPAGEMMAVNPAYTSRYGVATEEYLGNQDRDAWGDCIARQFGRNDAEVVRTRKPATFIETIQNRKTGKPESILVIKFPVYRGPDFVGVGGVAVYIPVEQ